MTSFWACHFFLTSCIESSVSHLDRTANANSLMQKEVSGAGAEWLRGRIVEVEMRGKDRVGEVGYHKKLKEFWLLIRTLDWQNSLLILSANSLIIWEVICQTSLSLPSPVLWLSLTMLEAKGWSTSKLHLVAQKTKYIVSKSKPEEQVSSGCQFSEDKEKAA